MRTGFGMASSPRSSSTEEVVEDGAREAQLPVDRGGANLPPPPTPRRLPLLQPPLPVALEVPAREVAHALPLRLGGLAEELGRSGLAATASMRALAVRRR